MNIKHIVKIILGKALSHKLGSYLYFRRNRDVKELLKINIDLKDKYKGKRCFIFGNGPSLKSLDFSKFKDEYTFTVNLLTKHPNYEKLKTSFHMYADENFFYKDSTDAEIKEVVEAIKKINTKDNKPICFFKNTASDFLKKCGLDNMLNIRYFAQGAWEQWDSRNYFSFDDLVPGFGTVVQYCICLAVYMGFSEIYLLGCDCTGIINAIEGWMNLDNSGNQNLQYAYKVSEDEKKIHQRGHMNCSIKDEFLGWGHLFNDYEKLRDYCSDKGVKIYNATRPTLLQSIELVNIDDILN